MIFLKARDWESSRQVVYNLNYVIGMAETENRRKTKLEILYGKDSYYLMVDRNSIKFVEVKTPEDANGFLSEEDMRVE